MIFIHNSLEQNKKTALDLISGSDSFIVAAITPGTDPETKNIEATLDVSTKDLKDIIYGILKGCPEARMPIYLGVQQYLNEQKLDAD